MTARLETEDVQRDRGAHSIHCAEEGIIKKQMCLKRKQVAILELK